MQLWLQPALFAAIKFLRHLTPLRLTLLDNVHTNLHAYFFLARRERLAFFARARFILDTPLMLLNHLHVFCVGCVKGHLTKHAAI